MQTDLTPHISAPAQESDKSLLGRLCAGDDEAGDELVRRYSPALLRYLRRLMGSDHLAEELHQQTWISVLEHLDKFDASLGNGGFKSWLYRIATNKANDHWRALRREKSASHELQFIRAALGPESSHRMDQAQQQDKLRQAIEKLPENQKQVLLLRYYSELKFVEIAQMLGCPLNTALGRMHKAMLKLKDAMSS